MGEVQWRSEGAVGEMMNEVERYLQRATRGLWGRKRQEVREELEVHISERMMAYRIAGLSEADAVERALREMGQPQEVSAGMTRIYTVPWVAGSSVVFAAVCAITVTVASLGAAQMLQTTQTFPAPVCLETPNAEDAICHSSRTWTTVEALQEVLRPQGVQVNKGYDTISLQFDDGTLATARLFPFTRDDSEALSDQPKPNYFLVWDFLESLANDSFLPVRIEGWNNPTVHVGNASFVLSGKGSVEGKSLYQSYLTSTVFNPSQLLAHSQQAHPSNTIITYTDDKENANALTLRIRGSEPNAVYGVLAPRALSSFAKLEPDIDFALSTDVAQVNANGSIDVLLSTPSPLTFLESFTGELEVGTAVLVRLTGESKSNGIGFSYEVVPPEQIQEVN